MHIKVVATAGAPRDTISLKNSRYHIATKELASEGRANKAIKLILAEHLSISPSQLSLIKGARTPSKIFIRRDI